MRVLVVEDDRRLAASLRRSLMESRMAVDVAHNGEDGLAAASTTQYDVIIADLFQTGQMKRVSTRVALLENPETADSRGSSRRDRVATAALLVGLNDEGL